MGTAQSLSEHQWRNRVILLFAPDFQNEDLQQQLNLFRKNYEGLKERKLITYQISQKEIKLDGVTQNTLQIKNWRKRYKIKRNEFTLILIGLDGGEKMRSSTVISMNQLFGKIDQMPMRRAEIRNNKN